MILRCLSENTAAEPGYLTEHGLSLYIESGDRRFLFDVGASENFLKNARKMDVDIASVDFLVLSHGHYDHGGGLPAFLRENGQAPVYVHPLAFGEQVARREDGRLDYIGLPQEAKDNPRLIWTGDRFQIAPGLSLFSAVPRVRPGPSTNRGLLRRENGVLIVDPFQHEQNLLIQEDDRSILLTGCAHNGIDNILLHFRTLYGHMPDTVIGGFHLARRFAGNEEMGPAQEIADFLARTSIQCYTCHCTGLDAYAELHTRLGSSVAYLASGETIEI